MFLLRYIDEIGLRKTIQSVSDKSGEFNNFTKWLFSVGKGFESANGRTPLHAQ